MDIRAELSRILASPAFASQERLQKFLSYVVERTLDGHGHDLKETAIAFDDFERRSDYDSKVDPIVRVQARRLREKLEEYYSDPRNGPAVRIAIPKGGYVPEFSRCVTPAATTGGEAATTATPAPSKAAPADRRRAVYFILGASTVVAAAIVLGIYRHNLNSPPAVRLRPFADGRGYYQHPALSPDGRQIAFDWDEGGAKQTGVYVQALDSDAPRRLSAETEWGSRPTWSPDAKQIAFARKLSNTRAAIVVVRSGGGAERVLTEIATAGEIQRLDWSGDGSTIVTARPASADGRTLGLILISVANGSQRTLTNAAWGTPGDSEAAFSPDGVLVAFRRGKATSVEDVFIIPAHGGAEHQVTSDNSAISGLDWAPDSKSIVFGSRRSGEAYSLWRAPLRGGNPLLLASVPHSAAWPSVARNGERIAFSLQTDDENIWRLDTDGKSAATAVIDSGATDNNPSLSRDGAYIAFRSARTGGSEIWISGSNGSSAHRVTHCEGVQCGSPDWSPDGRTIAYDARVHSVPHIYLIPRDGGTPARLTSDEANEVVPHWSRDGRSIYYTSNASGQYEIWKKAVNGGPAVQLTHNGGYSAQESFDEKMLYFTKGPEKPGLWRMPLAGGPEEEVAPELRGRMWGNWRVAMRGAYFLDFTWEEKPYMEKVYFYDFGTGQTRVVASTPGVAAAFNSGLAVSPDERSVWFVQVDHPGSNIYFAEGLTW